MAKRAATPMNQGLAKDAGAALFWKAVQQGGDNLIYLFRLVILAWFLTPDDFGLFAIALTGFVPLLVITDFGMIPALVQRPEATDRHYNTAWTVGMLRAVIIFGVVFLTAPIIAAIFAEPRAVAIIRALSVLPLLEAAASIKIAELIQNLRFRSLGIAKLVQALANTIISIALARSLGVWALVVGTLAGPSAYIALSYILAPHRPRISFDRSAARSLISYGQWMFMTGLISISGAVALRVAISRQLGVAELGLYSLAAKVAFLPHEIASEVVGGVSFPVYARLQSNIRQATKAFRAIFIATLLALTPLFSLMIVLAPSLVSNLLGSQWQGTTPLIRSLAVVSLLRVICDVTVPVFKGVGKPYNFALLEGVQTVILITCVWGFIDYFGLIGTGYAWFTAAAAGLIVSIVLLRQSLQHPFTGLARSLITIGLTSATGGLIALYIDQNWPSVLGFSLAILAPTGIIGSILWISYRTSLREFAKDFARAFPKAAAVLPGFER
jgi:O-antigen/teichoic acid export membrane protein